jgi:hypothetical protein
MNRFISPEYLMETVMTMTIPAGYVRHEPGPGVLDRLRSAWEGYRDRRALREGLRRAGRLGPRLMADMGVDTAVARGWDDLRPNGFLVRSR